MDFFPKANPPYSVLIPVYNSEKTIRELWSRTQRVFSDLDEDYEAVMVDDGSRDGVWNAMQDIASKDKRVKLVQLSRNFGQQNAVLCGFRFCRGEFVITMDDDLQDPPEEIPKLISAIRGDPDADVVCGRTPATHSAFRSLLSFFHNRLQNSLFGVDPGLRVSSLKILRRPVVQEILQNRSKSPLLTEILFEVTRRVRNIDLAREKRRHGRSGYTLATLVSASWDMVLNRSDLPLRLISVLGFTSALVSIGMIAFYLTRYFLGGIGVSGWTTLVIINLFFPGVVLFSFGVMGQYLIRIMREVNYTPQYVIRQTRGID